MCLEVTGARQPPTLLLFFFPFHKERKCWGGSAQRPGGSSNASFQCPDFPYNPCPSPVCERIVLQVQYHHLYLGWSYCTSVLSGLRVRSEGQLRYICSGWEATPGHGGQHPSPQDRAHPIRDEWLNTPGKPVGWWRQTPHHAREGRGGKAQSFPPSCPTQGQRSTSSVISHQASQGTSQDL